MRYLKVVQLMVVISDAQDFKDGYIMNTWYFLNILYRIVLSNYSFRPFKTRLCDILWIYYKRIVSIMINIIIN